LISKKINRIPKQYLCGLCTIIGRYERMLDNRSDWDIKADQVSIEMRKQEHHANRWQSVLAAQGHDRLPNTLSVPSSSSLSQTTFTELYAKWNSHEVTMRRLGGVLTDPNQPIARSFKRLLISLKELNHENIAAFHGLLTINNDRLVVVEFCSKGMLSTVLQDDRYNISEKVKFSFTNDIVSGMNFLHLKGIIHGCLSSDVCVVDKRWTVKISHWDDYQISRALARYGSGTRAKNSVAPTMSLGGNGPGMQLASYAEEQMESGIAGDLKQQQYKMAFELLWYAPEKLANETLVTKSADVYSFGVVLYEIFTRKNPYENNLRDSDLSKLLRAICMTGLRPSDVSLVPAKVRKVMELAWSADDTVRPTFDALSRVIAQMCPTAKGGAIDSMLDELDAYSRTMEDQLAQKQAEIEALKAQLATVNIVENEPTMEDREQTALRKPSDSVFF
jgi:serine/threonine protein kinase